MVCPVVRRTLCHAARDHYIMNHMNRYVKTLLDKNYMKSINITKDDAMKEISRLYDLRISLQSFDQVVNGKRIKKITKIFDFDFDM